MQEPKDVIRWERLLNVIRKTNYQLRCSLKEVRNQQIIMEFVTVEKRFSLSLIDSLSKEWEIPINLIFIGSPSSESIYHLSDMHGVRLIIWILFVIYIITRCENLLQLPLAKMILVMLVLLFPLASIWNYTRSREN